MRGEMIYGPAIVFIVYGIKNRISTKWYVLFALFGIIIVGFVPYFRMSRLYGTAYLESLNSIAEYKQLAVLIPFIQTFSANFSILTRDISIFPQIVSFGFGDYSILPAIPVLNLGKSLMNVQNAIFNKGFYGGLTATFLATWYADFGYIGMIIQTMIMAWWNNFVFKKFIKTQQFFTLMWYAYTFYASLWLVYNNSFDIVYIIYCILLWGISKSKIT